MAPKRKKSEAAPTLSDKPAETAAAKRRRSAHGKAPKPATSTQTAAKRRSGKRPSEAASAPARRGARTPAGHGGDADEASAAPARPAKRLKRGEAAAEGGAAAAAAPKRARLAPVAEEEEGPVEHPSHLKVAGDIFVIGDGDCGQFGRGEDVAEALRPAPSPIPDKKVKQVAAGGMHSVALTEDGEVWTTGVNDEGALGRETAGELWEKSGAAKGSPGDSYTWGRVDAPADHGRIVQVSAGDSHTAALSERGCVWAWGTFRDASGVFGFSPGQRIALLPALVHSPATAAQRAVKVASGADHVVALTAGGALLSWGSGQQGQLGRVGSRLPERTARETLLRPHPVPFTRRIRGLGTPRIVDFACGTYSTFALAAGGHVFAWGLNNYGQLTLPGQEPIYSPVLVRALEGKGVCLVRPGQHHTLFLCSDGAVLSVGRPTYGRLGRRGLDAASDEAVPAPAQVDTQESGLAGARVVGLAAGLAVSGAVGEDGRAWLWGFGTNNQLGKGNDDGDEEVPRALVETNRFSARRVVQLEFGGQHTLLLTVPKPEAAQTAGTADAPEDGADDGPAAAAGDDSGCGRRIVFHFW